jgi:AcrR family transcriptional regulator
MANSTSAEARPAARRRAILDGALERFSHYGFRRTSMEDIAQTAGISRAALYLHFNSKEDIFRGLAMALHERSLAAAETAATTAGPLTERLQTLLEAKLAAFVDIVYGTAHARELLDENSRVCGDISVEFRKRYLALLKRVLDRAVRDGEIAPASHGLSTAGLGELLLDSAKGIETSGSTPLTPERFRQRLRQLVQVIVQGVAAAPRATVNRGRSGSRPQAM